LQQRVDKVEEALEIYSQAGNAVREELARKLEAKVFEWYKQLAASHEFKQLRIDPEDYQLRGVPDGADQEYSISDYQGGGQRTLTALAYQLAIAESTGRTSLLMIDEPTDATDSDNRSRLLEMIHQAVDSFNQIILITHHGAGREKAEHIIQVDKDGETSNIRRPRS
jgi:DNA repair exonuclease SbcCD ATPase subunit